MIPVLKKRENTTGNRLVWWMREVELIDMTTAQHRVIARRINRAIRAGRLKHRSNLNPKGTHE